MKLKTLRNLCAVMCAIVFSSALFATDATPDASQMVTQQSNRSRNNNKNNGKNHSMWVPYFMKLREVEPNLTSFYEQNVGIGFLYFSGIKGNLQPANNSNAPKFNHKLNGHLMYNRTPVSEYVIGTDIFRWWKIGISYQHQGGITVQTRPQVQDLTVGGSNTVDLASHVRLDAVMFKTYFMFPYSIVWMKTYHTPYLGVAVGPGWQSWVFNESGANFSTLLRPKFSANCVYTIDLGMKLRKAMPNYMMSFTIGCKYTQWGQARSIGKQSQQYAVTVNDVTTNNGQRIGFSNPFRIETVFQFAPYIGVQFNF